MRIACWVLLFDHTRWTGQGGDLGSRARVSASCQLRSSLSDTAPFASIRSPNSAGMFLGAYEVSNVYIHAAMQCVSLYSSVSSLHNDISPAMLDHLGRTRGMWPHRNLPSTCFCSEQAAAAQIASCAVPYIKQSFERM